jgi:hypothetical protein
MRADEASTARQEMATALRTIEKAQYLPPVLPVELIVNEAVLSSDSRLRAAVSVCPLSYEDCTEILKLVLSRSHIRMHIRMEVEAQLFKHYNVPASTQTHYKESA